MARIKVTIEVIKEVEGKSYTDKETIYEQIFPDAKDENVHDIIKAANGFTS